MCFERVYEVYGASVQAAVMAAAAATPTVFTKADVVRALCLLHAAYVHGVHDGPKPDDCHPDWAVFKSGIVPVALLAGRCLIALLGLWGALLIRRAGSAVPLVRALRAWHLPGAALVLVAVVVLLSAVVLVLVLLLRLVVVPVVVATNAMGWGGPAGESLLSGTASGPFLIVLRVWLGQPVQALAAHLTALQVVGSSQGCAMHVVSLVSSRMAVVACVDGVPDVLAAAMDADVEGAAVADALRPLTVPPGSLVVVLDWGLDPSTISRVAQVLGVPVGRRHVVDLPSLPVSFMVCTNSGLPGCGLHSVQLWCAERCALRDLPADCGDDPRVQQVVAAAGAFLQDWYSVNNIADWARDDEARIGVLQGVQLPPAALQAANQAICMHVLGLSAEQLRMCAAMWETRPGDGKWLVASGIIGGGKTTTYQAFMAMAATDGWSVVATAQTNAATLAVGGDKCLKALLEIAYVRDRVFLYYKSDMAGSEYKQPVLLRDVVAYLSSPDVGERLQARLQPLTHLIIDEVSQVNKLLMTLVVVVLMMFKPDLNVVIGGDARQIPCPPEHRGSLNGFF